MSALSAAVAKQQWEIAAYLLVIGLAKVAPRVPPETLAELMLLLEQPGKHPGPTHAPGEQDRRNVRSKR